VNVTVDPVHPPVLIYRVCINVVDITSHLMNESSQTATLQGIAIVLFAIQLTLVDLAMFPDGGTVIAVGGSIAALVGVVHAFKPLL